MVSLHYTITKEDYINFYTHVMWDAGDRRKSRIKNVLRQVVFVAAFLAVYYFAGGFQYLSRLSVIIIILMFSTSLLPLIGGRSSTQKEGQEIADDPENAFVFSDLFVTATEKGINVKNDISDLNYLWKAIVRKSETKNYYFLFLNAIHAIIIPKRVFASEAEKNEFEKILTVNLSLDAEVKDSIHAGE